VNIKCPEEELSVDEGATAARLTVDQIPKKCKETSKLI
jgi:hypothetical protein